MAELRGLGKVVILNRMVKVSLVGKLNFEQGFEGVAPVDMLRRASGSQNSQCKGPEVGACLEYSRNSKEASD